MAYFRCVGGNIRPEKTINLTLHGAKGDNIGIYDEDYSIIGSAIFDADATEKTITIDIIPNKQYAFISTVAKALDGSTTNYSKTVLLTQDPIQEVNVFPDGALYWYGNKINSAARVTASFPTVDSTPMSFNGMTTPTPVDTSNYTTINGICDYTRDGDKNVLILFGDVFSSERKSGLVINRKFTAEVVNRTGNINLGIFVGGGISTSELSHTEYTNHENFKTSPSWGDYILDMYAIWLE